MYMLSFSPEALEHAKASGKPLYLDLPPVIGCCIQIRECPAVRTGIPHQPQAYQKTVIDGITVYIPNEFPDVDLTIGLSSFLGFKRLVIDGWHLA